MPRMWPSALRLGRTLCRNSACGPTMSRRQDRLRPLVGLTAGRTLSAGLDGVVTAANIEDKPYCDQRCAPADDLDREEGRARAVGGRYHGYDYREKRYHEAGSAHQPSGEGSAGNEGDIRLIAACTAAKHRQ